MYRTYCDRCGQEIFVKPSPLNDYIPMYRVQVKRTLVSGYEATDLCAECKRKLQKWMKNKDD